MYKITTLTPRTRWWTYAIFLVLFIGIGSIHAQEEIELLESEDEVYSKSLRFQIPYEVVEPGPADLAKIELWFTRDEGASWQYFGVDSDLTSPVDFECVEDGRYGFWVVASDRANNRELAPKPGDMPDLTVVVDQRPPEVRIISPKPGMEIKGGHPFLIQWEVKDENLAPMPISIYYAYRTQPIQWNRISTREGNDSAYLWSVPKGSMENLQIKIEALDKAGNLGEAILGGGIAVKPFNKGTQPVEVEVKSRVNTVNLDIHYEVKNTGASGAFPVELWYTRNQGKKWVKYGIDQDKISPIRFVAPGEGLYGFAVVVKNPAGYSENPPVSGVKPEIYALVDTTQPRLIIRKPANRVNLQGQTMAEVHWYAFDEYFGGRPISIYFSKNKGEDWYLVQESLENNGIYLWDVPALNGSDFRLKVEAIDWSGNFTSDVISVTIDTKEPTSKPTNIVASLGGFGFLVDPKDPLITTIQPATVDKVEPEVSENNEEEVKDPEIVIETGDDQVVKDPDPPVEQIKRVTFEDAKLAKEHFDRGNIKRIQGKRSEAEEAYLAALALNPRYIKAINDLASTYSLLGRYEEAVSYFSKAIEIDPQYAKGYYNLGTTHIRQNFKNEAKYAYEKAVELEPRNPEYWWQLSQTYLKLKDIKNARRCWEAILKIESEGSSLHTNALYALDRY